jgi:hypothetical protein
LEIYSAVIGNLFSSHWKFIQQSLECSEYSLPLHSAMSSEVDWNNEIIPPTTTLEKTNLQRYKLMYRLCGEQLHRHDTTMALLGVELYQLKLEMLASEISAIQSSFFATAQAGVILLL